MPFLRIWGDSDIGLTDRRSEGGSTVLFGGEYIRIVSTLLVKL
jgi:hypothetical protein